MHLGMERMARQSPIDLVTHGFTGDAVFDIPHRREATRIFQWLSPTRRHQQIWIFPHCNEMELDFNTGSEGGSGGETDGSESNLAAYGEGMVRAAGWIGTHWVRAHLARQDPSQSEPEVRGAGFANSYEPAEIE